MSVMRIVRKWVNLLFLALIFGAVLGSAVDDAKMMMRPKPKHQIVFTEEEIGCLREAMYYEGRGGLVGEQIMQGMVIIARATDPDPQWPKTICGVVHQVMKGVPQFSYWGDKALMDLQLEGIAWGNADHLARRLANDVWREQFLPRGAECVRSYKMSDAALAKLSRKSLEQLRVSKRSLDYFERTQIPVFTVGSHTFYRDKEGCKEKLPTT
jgi:Cell Wall Hydrolase